MKIIRPLFIAIAVSFSLMLQDAFPKADQPPGPIGTYSLKQWKVTSTTDASPLVSWTADEYWAFINDWFPLRSPLTVEWDGTTGVLKEHPNWNFQQMFNTSITNTESIKRIVNISSIPRTNLKKSFGGLAGSVNIQIVQQKFGAYSSPAGPKRTISVQGLFTFSPSEGTGALIFIVPLWDSPAPWISSKQINYNFEFKCN